MKSCNKLCENDIDELINLWIDINKSGSSEFFHPHKFNVSKAYNVCVHPGDDIYLGGWLDDELVCYGMLRGWNEGYEIPSLGIYISSKHRGLGLSTWFMKELHEYAKAKGAKKIRLTVAKDNEIAIKLYQKLGYILEEKDITNLIGFINLETR